MRDMSGRAVAEALTAVALTAVLVEAGTGVDAEALREGPGNAEGRDGDDEGHDFIVGLVRHCRSLC